MKNTSVIRDLSRISSQDTHLVGVKAVALGQLHAKRKKDYHIPSGFVVTTDVYKTLMRSGLGKKIKHELRGIDVENLKSLNAVGKKIRTWIMAAKISRDVQSEITKAFDILSGPVAVRSSAVCESLPDASFAGQYDSFLNIKTKKDLLLHIQKCIASVFSDRALQYRHIMGYDHSSFDIAIIVQEMYYSAQMVSGVMSTFDAHTGHDGVLGIDASYGLPDGVLKGNVVADQFLLFKKGITKKQAPIISRRIGEKAHQWVPGKTKGVIKKTVLEKKRNRFCLTDQMIGEIAWVGMQLEKQRGASQVIEWAYDRTSKRVIVLQARSEKIDAREQVSRNLIERYSLHKESDILAEGAAVGRKIGAGKVKIVTDEKDLKKFKDGQILVAKATKPEWEPSIRRASAIITEQGSTSSHAAVISRELGVPCVVGVQNALTRFKSAMSLTVDCSVGSRGKIYKGILPFEVEKRKVSTSNPVHTDILVGLTDPENALGLSRLPVSGAGVLSFADVYTHSVKAHPMALLTDAKKVKGTAKKRLREITKGYTTRKKYLSDKLTEGISLAAAAFSPHEVIVQLSAHDSAHLKGLLGEHIGQKIMKNWQAAVTRTECKAIVQARAMGLKNIHVMIPACATLEQALMYLKLLKKYGIERKRNESKIYANCLIPNNAVFASAFAEHFDNVFLTTKDGAMDELTSIVAQDVIASVIREVHKKRRKVGFFGTLASDDVRLTDFLVQKGIDTLCLQPDVVLPLRERVVKAEKTVGKTGVRTNSKLLSMVVGVGLLGAMLIGAGAGCTQVVELPQKGLSDELSPAELRSRIETQVRATMQKAQDAIDEAALTTLDVASFAQFSLKHHPSWEVSSWNGGITVSSDDGEYISVFEQLVSHPVADSDREEISVDGTSGSAFTLGEEDKAVRVVEIERGDIVIEINAKGKRAIKSIDTIRFADNQGVITHRKATHWDVREGRICAQMITYARPSKRVECTAHETPCDVPDGWEVCDASDI